MNLVARLRKIAGHELDHPAAEAADEIERLERELYLLRNERDNLVDNVHRLTTTIESRDG